MKHVDVQLRHLKFDDWCLWHDGNERRGDDVGIWGFGHAEEAEALRA